ncbi:transcription antiterminator BglG [Mangrovibacter phragmitis]|uniref:Transcription antiterminator BglG n=1 Tax=Mangrovibacter phragmitis TaxID=1691903 RepID=A0A1B7L2C1_9ENTR|nr:PRD domain-containing protein [Mangrovibacter phragmitis]OAT76401.1 transcription antiterminator BglG [Mangrovibacter phragmitis]
MRFPNQRLAQLFCLLENETLPQDELARRLAVSTRTVRADITALNTLLACHGAQFILSRGTGYQLRVTDPGRFGELQSQHQAPLRIPRTSADRVNYLLVRFLTSAFSLKLEDLADEWFISRATLQGDMVEVRDVLARYNLSIEARPRHGMKLFGDETAVRACLTDLLWQISQQDSSSPLIQEEALNSGVLAALEPTLQNCLEQFAIRMTDESVDFLRFYCAVAVRRISEGYPIASFHADNVDEPVRQAASTMSHLLGQLSGKALSDAEENWLQVHFAARRIQDADPCAISADDDEALVSYILRYINSHYNYDLTRDQQLHADLLTHIKTMITRVRYQIHIPNPLLQNIKQHYPLAWDMTLAAVASWGKHTPYTISENEVGFLVLHIGVGLERHYNIGWQRNPQVLLVCDTGNSTVRMIQAQLVRKYPQIEVTRIISLRDYEQLDTIAEDFVISTARLVEKDKPVATMSPFPSDYQVEQIGKLVLVDRTRPWMLERFFDARYFRIIDKPVSQQALFTSLCQQLEREGIVGPDFLPSVAEREAIVSTMLGDGIALPHSLGLLAHKTVVYTVLAPQGIAWGDETAKVIFLLAISKEEYEEAMAIYDLFVTFLREQRMPLLKDCQNFDEFKAVAVSCLSTEQS